MYAGQTWDNRLPLWNGEIDAARVEEMVAQVHDFYRARYGFSAEELGIVLTTIEVTGVARRRARPRLARPAVDRDPLIGTTSLLLGSVEHPDTPIYRREHLPVGYEVNGPAVIVERYATTVVDETSTAVVDDQGSLRITLR
jgi:N-methylhydantoinase A